MTTIDDIKDLLAGNLNDEAIAAAETIVNNADTTPHERATALFLRGNAYRRLGNWRMAQNSYLESMNIEPQGPAAMAYQQAQEILNFYHKDYYNP